MSFEAGRDAFNAREFYEAHEFWEEIWRPAEEPDRTWLQGLIQVAAGFHKVKQGAGANGVALLERGLGKLADAPARFHGIDVAALRADVLAAREALCGSAGAASFPDALYPILRP